MIRFTGQSAGGPTNTYNTSKGYWNNNTQKSSTLPLLRRVHITRARATRYARE
jgi:hypothetical protein